MDEKIEADRSGRRGRTDLNYLPSPNRPSTSSRNAPASFAASGPVVSTSISQPLAAVSINSPMMESPGTLNPSLVTIASASNASTVSTNRAEARACNPFSLRTVRTCFTGKNRPDRWSCPAGLTYIDVLPTSGHACGDRIVKRHMARLEQLQEHRNIRAAKDRPGRAIARGHREIAGRTADQVYRKDDATPAIDRIGRLANLPLLGFAVTIGFYRNCTDPGLFSDDVFDRLKISLGKFAMPDDHHANHVRTVSGTVASARLANGRSPPCRHDPARAGIPSVFDSEYSDSGQSDSGNLTKLPSEQFMLRMASCRLREARCRHRFDSPEPSRNAFRYISIVTKLRTEMQSLFRQRSLPVAPAIPLS